MRPRDDRPTFVAPGAGTVLDDLGVIHKLTSRETGGSIYLFESTLGPGEGNRLHVHRQADEISYVLDGALEIRLADSIEMLETGGIARLPKGIPHAIRNPLGTASRYLFMALPGGLDRYFDAVNDAERHDTLDDEALRRLAAEHGLDWLE